MPLSASLCCLLPVLQELEKLVFVLEYSIGELRSQAEPQELALADMRERVAVSGGTAWQYWVGHWVGH